MTTWLLKGCVAGDQEATAISSHGILAYNHAVITSVKETQVAFPLHPDGGTESNMIGVMQRPGPFLSAKASALLSHLVVRAVCSWSSASGSLPAKSRGRKYSLSCSRINGPGRKGLLGATKTDGNTAPFQGGKGMEVRGRDKGSGDSAGAQEANKLVL